VEETLGRVKYRIVNPAFFLKYAYPCIEFWYKNEKLARELEKPWADEFYKIISPTLLKKLRLIAQGKEKLNSKIERKLEKLVPFAFYFLKKLGKKDKGEVVIDEEIIRNYFLSLHEKVLGMRKKKYKKIFELCKIKEGMIVELRKKYAKVKIGKKYREVRLDFIDNPKVGDRVRIHFFYACEKI